MTANLNPTSDAPPQDAVSPLPFDQATLAQGIRVRPAQFARMCEVSRQTVSEWVRKGHVQLFPDGTLDPAAAAKRILSRADPHRLRAKVFKEVAQSTDDWRKRCLAAEAALANVKKEAECRAEWAQGWIRESERAEEIFQDMLVERIEEIRVTPDEALVTLLSAMRDAAIMQAGVELGNILPD